MYSFSWVCLQYILNKEQVCFKKVAVIIFIIYFAFVWSVYGATAESDGKRCFDWGRSYPV